MSFIVRLIHNILYRGINTGLLRVQMRSLTVEGKREGGREGGE